MDLLEYNARISRGIHTAGTSRTAWSTFAARTMTISLLQPYVPLEYVIAVRILTQAYHSLRPDLPDALCVVRTHSYTVAVLAVGCTCGGVAMAA